MNATRLILSLALSLALGLAGCGGGGSSSATGVDGGITNPGAPGAPSGGDNGGTAGEPGTPGAPRPDDGDNKPDVVSTDPEPQSASVDRYAAITVMFDDVIDPASVSPSAMYIAGPAGEVDIDVSVTGASLVIRPMNGLQEGATYTATIDGGIRNLDGNSMGEDYSWQFAVAKEITGVCADFYADDFALVQGKDATRPLLGLIKPFRGTPFADPAYGSCVTRASNALADLGTGWVRNYYSRQQAFNADESLYLALAQSGTWHVYNTTDTRLAGTVQLSGGTMLEPQWHPTDPDILFYLESSGGLTIRTYNVETGERRIVADLRNVASIAGYPGLTSITQVWPDAARAWTRWEGSPSADARYWAFMVQTSGQSGRGMISYDMQTDTITGVYDYGRDGNGVPQPDHISMSPSGRYVVPSWDSPGCVDMAHLGTRGNPCGLMAFSRDFRTAVGLTMNSPHSDIGLDADGRDVIVGADYVTGWVEMWDLATGARTHLWNIWEDGNGTGMHISARSLDKPGWALISTYSERKFGWHATKIMAVEMKANPRILNIAHTYNSYSSYWTEPQATVNRDFTRILFNSNWGVPGENMDVYMITLPGDAVPAQ